MGSCFLAYDGMHTQGGGELQRSGGSNNHLQALHKSTAAMRPLKLGWEAVRTAHDPNSCHGGTNAGHSESYGQHHTQLGSGACTPGGPLQPHMSGRKTQQTRKL